MPPKKSVQRRESTVREFRAEVLSTGPANEYGTTFPTNVDQQIKNYNKIVQSKQSELQQRLGNAYTIKQMRATGEYSDTEIEEEKKRLGMATTETTTAKSSGYDMLMMQIAQEEDKEKRGELLQTLVMVESMGKAKSDPAMNMMMMSMMGKKSEKKSSTFEEKMMEKAAEHLFKEPKSELDNLDKLQKLIKGLEDIRGDQNPLKETLDTIKQLKDADLIEDKRHTIEDHKLRVDELKINKEYEIREREIELEKGRNEAFGKIAGDALSSGLDAIAAGLGGKDAETKTRTASKQMIDNSVSAICAVDGCGKKILISNANTSRQISCSGCGRKYEFDAKERKLYLLEDHLVPAPEKQSSGPPV